MIGDMKIFAGRSNPKLAQNICNYLDIEPGKMAVDDFPDGETRILIQEDVRGKDVFLIQPTCPPVNQNLVELLIMIDACRRASASRVTAVIPYFGYARQDRKHEGRVPITAKMVANLLESAGIQRAITMDLHATQIQGFFDIPVDNLYSSPVMIKYFSQLNLKDPVIVAPDVGSAARARAYSKRLKCDWAVIDKRRTSDSTIEATNVIGNVRSRECLLVDDMISTAGTICEGARALKAAGADLVYVAATHPVLCGPAFQRIREAPFTEVIVTDTIPLKNCDGIPVKVLSVAELIGEAITRTHEHRSVSSLFD